MRIYRKNPNKTAQEIAELIKRADKNVFEKKISKEAYKWLTIENMKSLAKMVEEIFDGKFHIIVGSDKYVIRIIWHEVEDFEVFFKEYPWYKWSKLPILEPMIRAIKE